MPFLQVSFLYKVLDQERGTAIVLQRRECGRNKPARGVDAATQWSFGVSICCSVWLGLILSRLIASPNCLPSLNFTQAERQTVRSPDFNTGSNFLPLPESTSFAMWFHSSSHKNCAIFPFLWTGAHSVTCLGPESSGSDGYLFQAWPLGSTVCFSSSRGLIVQMYTSWAIFLERKLGKEPHCPSWGHPRSASANWLSHTDKRAQLRSMELPAQL